MLDIYNNMLKIYGTKGLNNKCLLVLSDILVMKKKYYGNKHVETANTYYALGECFIKTDEYNQAYDNLQRAN